MKRRSESFEARNSVNKCYTTQNNYLRAHKQESKKRENKRSCSSEKEHKMNALAPRAEEGRDNLR